MSDPISTTIGAELSEIQIIEIKKTFALLDLDGDGKLDFHEMRSAINQLMSNYLSDTEYQNLFRAMDKDQSGTVTVDDFIESLTDGLMSDEFASPAQKRRKTAEEERRDVHSKIKMFINQFKTGNDLDAIRRKIQTSGSISGDMFNWQKMNIDREGSSEQKLQALQDFRNTSPSLNDAITNLFSQSKFHILEAVKTIHFLFSKLEEFKTPIERGSIANDIAPFFEILVNRNVVKRLVELLSFNETNMLINVLKTISLFAKGPRINGAPHDSPLHPDSCVCKWIFVDAGIAPILFSLIAYNHITVQIKVLDVLSVFGSFHSDSRDYFLKHGIFEILFRDLNFSNASMDILRPLSWTVSVLCGVTHQSDKLPKWNSIQPMLDVIVRFLFINDEEVVRNILVAMALVLPGLPNREICTRLVEILSLDNHSIVKTDIITLTDISRFDPEQANLLIECGLLSKLEALLGQSEDVKIDTLNLIQELVHSHGWKLIDFGIVQTILNMLLVDTDLSWKLVQIIKRLTKGPRGYTEYLVGRDIIVYTCFCLDHFKKYDQLMSKIYSYSKPTYNFDLVKYCFTILENIINTGIMISEEQGVLNEYALLFTFECIHKIKFVLSEIKFSGPQINAWRHDAGSNVEIQALRILKIVHDTYLLAPESKENTSVINSIEECLAEYGQNYTHSVKPTEISGDQKSDEDEKETKSKTSERQIIAKLYYKDDVRVMTLKKNYTWELIHQKLLKKYELDSLAVFYVDTEDDKVRIDDNESLRNCIQDHWKSGRSTLKLFVENVKSEKKPEKKAESDTEGYNITVSKEGEETKVIKRLRSGEIKTPEPKTETSAFPLKTVDITSFSLQEDLKKTLDQQKKNFMEELESTTHFGRDEIEQLQNWVRENSEHGFVTRDLFKEGLTAIGITDPLQIELIFNTFENNEDGQIDFREFVSGLSVLIKGTPEEKAELLFKSYDINNDGQLALEEMLLLFHTEEKQNQDVRETVIKYFPSLKNPSSSIHLEEFKNTIITKGILIKK